MSSADEINPDMSPDEALALEWALGVLDEGTRAVAEARRQADPGFAALCAHWAASLAPLADDVKPERPSRAVWDAIEAEIAPPAFTPTEAPPEPSRIGSWWDSLALWRGATVGFAAVALALLAIPRPAAPPPPAPAAPAPAPASLLAATLAGEGGPPIATASLDSGNGQVVLSPLGPQAPEGRVPELWLIPADGKPRSLGVIALGGAQRIQVPETILQLVTDGATLAVSLEPVGGSPTGAPTGPVVATGKLATI